MIGESSLFTMVQVRHEVYSNHQIAQSTFPDRDIMRSEAETTCVAAFETYVGVRPPRPAGTVRAI